MSKKRGIFKLGIALIALIGTFSVVFAMNQKIEAVSSYSIGGEVYGQIGAPTIGDRIYLGTKDNFGDPLGWVLLDTYQNGHYIAASTDIVDTTTFFLNANDVPRYYQQMDYSKTGLWKSMDKFNARLKTNTQDMKLIAPRTVTWHNSLFKDPTVLSEINNSTYGWNVVKNYDGLINSVFDRVNYLKAVGILYYVQGVAHEFYGVTGTMESGYTGEKVAYVTSYTTLSTSAAEICAGDGRTCPWNPKSVPVLDALPYKAVSELIKNEGIQQPYFASHINAWNKEANGKENRFSYIVNTISGASESGFVGSLEPNSFGTSAVPIIGKTSGVRPTIEFDKAALDSKVVFSISPPTNSGNGVTTIIEPVRNFVDYYDKENMKLRILDETRTADFNDILFNDESIYTAQNITKSSVAKVADDATIQLQINANAKSDSYGTSTISVLVFDDAGTFIKYMPLSTVTSGENTYSLDISNLDLELGKKYSLKVVNEVYSPDVKEVTPANCSALSTALSIELFESLEMKYTPTYDEAVEGSIPYQHKLNVNEQDKIGEIDLLKGATPATVTIVQDEAHLQDGHDDDWENFTLYKSGVTNESVSKIKVSTDATTKSLIDVLVHTSAQNAPDVADGSLKPGVYYFKIQGVDNAGLPNPPLSKSVKVVVYPNESQITYTQAKNEETSTYYTKQELNALRADTAIGKVVLDGPLDLVSANIAGLSKDGYTLQSVTYVEVGKDTENAYLKSTMPTGKLSDPFEVNIMKKEGADFTDIKENVITFDILLTFHDGTSNTAVVRLSNQEFILPDGLVYYDAAGEKLVYTKEKPIEVTYDPATSADNKLQYYASNSAKANAMVKYCILDSNDKCTNSSSSTVVELNPDNALASAGSANAGKVNVKANAPGTESKKVTIRAMLVEQKDGKETILTSTDLYYQVNPARQKLAWVGENIQETGNHITQVDGEGNENQWEVALKYDATEGSTQNDIKVNTFVKEESAVDKVFNLQSDLVKGTATTGIKYSISSINNEDKDKFVLNADGSFTIKGDEFKDVVIIKAESEAVGNYAATEDTKKETAYLTITISKKPAVITMKDDASKIDSTTITLSSNEAKGTSKIINTGIDIPSLTGYGFEIEKIEYKATKDGTYAEVATKDFLIKNEVTDTSKAELWAKTGLNNATVLSVGYYKVTIKADKNGTEAATSKAFEIEVKKDTFAIEKIKWQSKETDKTAVDVGGTLSNDTKINSKTLEHAYIPSGEEGNSFKVIVANVEGNSSIDDDTTITYELSEDSDTGYISVASDGTITMNAVSKENTTLKVKATIKKKNFEDLIVYLPVKITPSVQILEWAGTNIYKSGNDVVKKADKTNEWTLSLQYDSSDGATNTYVVDELLKGETMSDSTLSVKTNLKTGTTPSLEYTLENFSKPLADTDKIEFDSSTKKLKLKGELSGIVNLKVCGNATGDYGETTSDGCAILTISVSSKPKVVFTPDYADGKIKALEDMAMGKTSLGDITLDPADTGKEYTYAVREVYQKSIDDKGTVTWPKLPSEIFKAVSETEEHHLYYNSDADSSGLSEGTYKIIIKAEKENGDEAIDKEVILIVTSAKLDVSKLKWTYKEENASYADVGGKIGTNNVNTKALTHVYSKKAFQVKVDNVTSGTLIDTGTTIKYSLVDPEDEKVLTVSESGSVVMQKASPENTKVQIKAVITKSGYDDTTVYLPITITKTTPTFQFVNKSDDPTVYPLVDESDPVHYESYKLTFEKDKGIDLFTVGAQGDVTIEIIDNGASKGNDVLKFKTAESTVNADSDNPKICTIRKEDYAEKRLSACEPLIEHAMNLISDKGKILVKATSAASDAYEAMSIEIPINIDKASQTDFKFKDAEITLESNTNGSFAPEFTGVQSSGYIILSTEKDANTEPDFTSEEMSVGEPNEALEDKYLSGISDFIYNIVVPSDGEERSGYVYAQKKGDRDYKDSDIKRQKVIILPEGSSMLTIKVESYPEADSRATNKVTYGDDHFKLTVMDDPEDPDNPPTYTFEVEEGYEDFASPIPDSTDSFQPTKAGDVYIKITQTDAKTGTKKTYRKKITINKRKVKMEIENIEKKVGMSVTEAEYRLKDGSEDFLLQDAIIMQNASFINNRSNGTPIVSLTNGVELTDNQLPITMKLNDSAEAKEKLSNYIITDLTGMANSANTPIPGKLIVTQDTANESWFKVVSGRKEDGTATTKGSEDWYNGPVNVTLLPASGSYDEISTDKETWDKEKFIYSNEGKHAVPVYFKQSSGDEKDAISDKAETTIKIDMTKPEVTSITGTEVKREGLEKLLHDSSFGIFFKQGVEVEIKAEDIIPGGAGNAGKIEISGVESVTYQIYEVDEDGHLSQTPFISEADKTLDQGVLKFNINSSGKYYISVTAKDKAGNVSDEAGSYLHVKKIDVDGDGDKIPDFNDPNGDGCPDLNILLGEDKDGNPVKLNVAEKNKNYPYMNIDSDGDGIADLNIDTDHDGKPDLNLVILTEKDSQGTPAVWNPTICVVKSKLKNYTEPIEYCTGTNVKPQINVDTDGDGIPDINIDTNGDFIADINIDTDHDGEADLNIVEITNWKPDIDHKVDNFLYDTMGNLIPLVNVDSDKDGYPDLNIDLDGDGIPDLNIDIDHDGIPEIDIDGNGDGIPDVNVDTDHDGKPNENKVVITEWKPEKNVDGKIHYDTMDITGSPSIGDGGIIIEKPDGGKFLPNTAIKVKDVSDTIDTMTKESIDKVAGDQVVKKVYDVNYIVDGEPGQPADKVNVKIPVDETIKHPKIIIEKEDGTFEIIDAKIEDGYYVFQTKYVGKVSIIGDPEDVVVDPDPEPAVNPDGEDIDKATSVKGNYTPSSNVQKNGIGGAYTGDETSVSRISMVCIFTLLGLVFLWKKQAHR